MIFCPGPGAAQQQARIPHGSLRQCRRQDPGGHQRGLSHLWRQAGQRPFDSCIEALNEDKIPGPH